MNLLRLKLEKLTDANKVFVLEKPFKLQKAKVFTSKYHFKININRYL
jgi:hypothetical protein